MGPHRAAEARGPDRVPRGGRAERRRGSAGRAGPGGSFGLGQWPGAGSSCPGRQVRFWGRCLLLAVRRGAPVRPCRPSGAGWGSGGPGVHPVLLTSPQPAVLPQYPPSSQTGSPVSLSWSYPFSVPPLELMGCALRRPPSVCCCRGPGDVE